MTHLSPPPSQPTQYVVTQTRTHSHITVCAFCLACTQALARCAFHMLSMRLNCAGVKWFMQSSSE
jgi:hypothetical protein